MHLEVWFRLVCKWNFKGVSKYKYPNMYKLEFMRHVRMRGPQYLKTGALLHLKLTFTFLTTDISLLDVALTPSNVASKPITPDPTTQLTKVFSTL